MANIREAFEYASKNPNSDFAKNLSQLAKSGALNQEAKKYGVDLTPFQPVEAIIEQPKKTIIEKVTDFTGGKEIAQGLGQKLARTDVNIPFIAKGNTEKMLEETQAQQIGIQTQLLEKIKQNKTQGLDTSRLENALAMITEDIQSTGQGAEKLLNPNQLTNKQVIGDALQLGTTIVGAGALPSAGKNIVAAETFKQGAIQGLKTGAITGAGFGASTGASQGLQGDKDLKGVAIDTLKGGVTGAVAGGVLGSLTGGISGAIKGRDATKLVKQEKNVLDAITPNTKNLSNKEYTKLLDQQRITPKTGTKGSQYILSESEKQTALKYPNLLTKKDPVKNYTAIVDEIAKQDEDVGTFLKTNNGIFNSGELKNSIKKSLADITDISIDEKVINKNKQKLIDNFIKGLDKNDMESLWRARKEFDKQIEKSFNGSPALQDKIKREFRNSVQDFIADRTPDEVYKTSMKEMSNLFKLKDLVKRKALTEKGQSAIKLWMRENPIKTKIIGIGAPALVGGAVLLD